MQVCKLASSSRIVSVVVSIVLVFILLIIVVLALARFIALLLLGEALVSHGHLCFQLGRQRLGLLPDVLITFHEFLIRGRVHLLDRLLYRLLWYFVLHQWAGAATSIVE